MIKKVINILCLYGLKNTIMDNKRHMLGAHAFYFWLNIQ